MSPASRGRKATPKQQRNMRDVRPAGRDVLPDPLELPGSPEECDCPACTGADIDPEEALDGMLAGAADLIGSEDPLDAEMMGAVYVSIGAFAGKEYEEALVGGMIPAFEARATTEALATLLAVAAVAPRGVGDAASAAADRLVRAGVPRPRWADELGEPVTVGDCQRLSDTQGTASMLACSFHRAGRSHAVVISVNLGHCGEADDILLLTDEVPLSGALDAIRADGRANGFEITTEPLDAAEFRWQVENALDARAVHDSEDGLEEGLLDPSAAEDADDDADGVGYPVVAALVRARMEALPRSGKAPAPHPDGDQDPAALSVLQMISQFAAEGASLGFRRVVAPLPPKRKKSDPPAPVYQIKVGLRGAKPPIWRRLEVPANISLARLHDVIQVAFGWDDSHMHLFETPYGEFGTADAELGHRAEKPVTLEQVAPAVNSKVRYTYDFGDNWEHDVLVEKVLERDRSARYPRCTGGRRAAPPDDCGGVWGYGELVEILGDPDHPEREERLEWLGLDDPTAFDPAKFDVDEVNRTLSALR
jgi:hypothetical protein